MPLLYILYNPSYKRVASLLVASKDKKPSQTTYYAHIVAQHFDVMRFALVPLLFILSFSRNA